MKPILSILLTACLLCGALTGAALAEGDSLRMIGVGFDTPEPFQELYPDLTLQPVKLTYTKDGENNLRELLLGEDWDVAMIGVGSAGITLRELYDRGLVMDLGGIPALAGAVDALYPAVRNALTVDGHLLGVPIDIYRSQMQLSVYTPDDEAQNAFARLGFTQADMPRTFSGLCDLAVAYAALPKSERKGTAFSVDCIATTSYHYFLYYLIGLYTAEFCDEEGNVDYDTPAFRAALDDLKRMSDALENLRASRGADGSMNALVCDAGTALAGFSENDHGLNLSIGNSESIPAKMSALVINPATAHPEAALRIVSILLEQVSAQFEPLLYQNTDYGTLAAKAYEQELVLRKMTHDPELESFIEQYTSHPEAFAPYTRAQLEDYGLNIAPHLTFRPVPPVNAYAAAKTYLKKNRLNVEGLIQFLNKAEAQGRET